MCARSSARMPLRIAAPSRSSESAMTGSSCSSTDEMMFASTTRTGATSGSNALASPSNTCTRSRSPPLRATFSFGVGDRVVIELDGVHARRAELGRGDRQHRAAGAEVGDDIAARMTPPAAAARRRASSHARRCRTPSPDRSRWSRRIVRPRPATAASPTSEPRSCAPMLAFHSSLQSMGGTSATSILQSASAAAAWRARRSMSVPEESASRARRRPRARPAHPRRTARQHRATRRVVGCAWCAPRTAVHAAGHAPSASFIFDQKPFSRCGGAVPCNSASCLSSTPLPRRRTSCGVQSCTRTCRSPMPVAFTRGRPRPRRWNTCPLCVPAGTRSDSSPSRRARRCRRRTRAADT